jgi:hypothetical protein
VSGNRETDNRKGRLYTVYWGGQRQKRQNVGDTKKGVRAGRRK